VKYVSTTMSDSDTKSTGPKKFADASKKRGRSTSHDEDWRDRAQLKQVTTEPAKKARFGVTGKRKKKSRLRLQDTADTIGAYGGLSRALYKYRKFIRIPGGEGKT